MQIGTNGLQWNGNFGNQEVKDQRHTRPKIDLEAWRRHRSRPPWVQ